MKRLQWIWMFYLIVSVFLVLGYSMAGKFSKPDPGRRKDGVIQLLHPEQPCRPFTLPCAAYDANGAIVVRIYADSTRQRGHQVEIRTLHAGVGAGSVMEGVWLDRSGSEIRASRAMLLPQQAGAYAGFMSPEPQATGLRLRSHQGKQTFVADLPLQD